MRRAAVTDLDARIRAAEVETLREYGLAREERYVDVDTGHGRARVRVSFTGEGTDLPPVLSLHGIGSAAALSIPVLPHLAGRRVISLDWPGHGLSDPCVLPPGADMRAHADAVVDSLLDALGHGRVDVMGHSMGAQIALCAALDLRDRVRRLVLLGAPGGAFAGLRLLAAMKVLAIPGVGPAVLARPMSDRAFDRFNDQALGVGALDEHPPALRETLRLLAARTANGPSLAGYFRAMVVRGRVRPGVALEERELARLVQPTLAAWGDADVFLAPGDAARSLVAIRDVHVVRVAGGHAPWLDEPDRVGAAIRRHLGPSVPSEE
jgi:pimeloyl-ACP methyl ester carboxylesterase